MQKEKFKEDNYRILLDSRWSLVDLNNFTRLYMQNYAFTYCLEANTALFNKVSLEKSISEYKLRDGLTYVSIYNIFSRHIVEHDKPEIRAISYASPGFIELILNYEVAVKIAESITIFLGLINETYTAYKNLKEIYARLARKRETNKIVH